MRSIYVVSLALLATIMAFSAGGCIQGDGYSNSWVYPEQVQSVYVEMFDSLSFRRGFEYKLTDAVCKRIEAQTPYKIVSDRDRAQTVLSGQIIQIGSSVLSYERNTGQSLENEASVVVRFTWKNLESGEIFVDNQTIEASESFSRFLGQDFDYAARAAVNEAAEKIIELMQKPW